MYGGVWDEVVGRCDDNDKGERGDPPSKVNSSSKHLCIPFASVAQCAVVQTIHTVSFWLSPSLSGGYRMIKRRERLLGERCFGPEIKRSTNSEREMS